MNLAMPGNPRYQPKNLQPYFGYDNLYRWVGKVEIASLEVMAEVGFMPADIAVHLTEETKERILAITTTSVDGAEQSTKHDIRAWVQEATKVVDPALANWLHLILTSYDPIDTGRSLMFLEVHREIVVPLTSRVMEILSDMVQKYSDQIQIGRTHGQHAIPITVGFWLATILSRIHYNIQTADTYAFALQGKISGAVGAYNAQVALGLAEKCGDNPFEDRVLEKLGLDVATISTQILPPEPIGYYLYSCVMLSACFAQLGEDCRQLMRSEIGEVREEFSSEQSGSSTMAHKRNPINFESLVGMFLKNKPEIGKVIDTLVSEHQRDLTASSVYRDFPIIVINLVQQLNTLLKENKQGVPFLQRISVDTEACRRNFETNSELLLAEPLYIALQMAGFPDAHHFINHEVVPRSKQTGETLIQIVAEISVRGAGDLRTAWDKVPKTVKNALHYPELYTGLAKEKALEVVNYVEGYLGGTKK